MAKEKETKAGFWSCCIPQKRRFPTFAVLLLIVSVVWLLSEIDVIPVDLPMWPVILIALALWWIIDFYVKR